MSDLIPDREHRASLEFDRLHKFLLVLPAADWGRSVAFTNWTIADVVAHLAWEAEVYVDSILRGLKGDTAPWTGFPQARAGDPQQVDRLVDERAVSLRQALGSRLLESFLQRYRQLGELIDGLAPKALDQACYHPLGVCRAGDFINLTRRELGIHSWDIRSCIDQSAQLHEECIPALVETFPKLVRKLFQVAALPAGPSRFRFATTGKAVQMRDVIISGRRLRLVEAEDRTPADLTIVCDEGTLALWLYGRLGFATALADGRVSAHGDPVLKSALA